MDVPPDIAKDLPGKGVDTELELLIRARYPIIYVITWEENRVEKYLQKIAEKRNKQLITWSVTSGFIRVGSSEGKKKGLADPIQALETVCDYKEPAIYLFKDFHAFMNKNHSNTAVIRKLREVATAISDSYKTLVITAPVLEMVPELEKDITVLDFPLPRENDFEELFEKICTGVQQSLSTKLEIDQESKEKLIQAALGLTLQEAENVFAKIIVNDGKLNVDD
ncbi:MAG: ATPase, partial [Planctomycetota bacterium]